MTHRNGRTLGGQPLLPVEIDLGGRRRDHLTSQELAEGWADPRTMTRDLRYPGHDLPMNDGEREEARTAWARFCRNGAIGKKSVLYFDAAAMVADPTKQPANVPMLSLVGNDYDATPMILTLAPPTIIPMTIEQLAGAQGLQNSTGEQGNAQVLTRNPIIAGEPGYAVWPPLQAIIEWGTGGTSARATVDYANGLTINLSASFLRVHAAVAPMPAGITGTTAAYALAAFASPGWTKPSIAQRTVYIGAIESGAESAPIPIPRFAKSAWIVACGDGAVPVALAATLRYWQSPEGVPSNTNVGNFAASIAQPAAFPVPNAAQYFSVRSGMAGSTLFSVVFDLAI